MLLPRKLNDWANLGVGCSVHSQKDAAAGLLPELIGDCRLRSQQQLDVREGNQRCVLPDLQQLRIEKGELRRLSQVNIDLLIRPPTRRQFLAEVTRTGLISVLLAMSGGVFSLLFPGRTVMIVGVHGAIALLLVADDIRKLLLSRQSSTLINLVEDVERFNTVIKAIDIRDQIERAGNPAAHLQNRRRAIAALNLAREDLIRALKTERILRENARFIQLNPTLFANNLTALTALRVDEQAGEYSRLLDEALEIAVGVQAEMRKLRGRHLSEP